MRRAIFAGLLLCGISLSPAGATASAARPDILLIMPDQMRGDCLSTVGHPVVRTPNFDELARQGTLFRRAYSTCPSCIPARFSLLTGLYPATSGVVGFKAKPIEYPTLPQLLDHSGPNAVGYATALVGRCMHQVPADEPYGYEKEIGATAYVENDDYDQFLKRVAPQTGGLGALIRKMGLSFNGWEAKPWPLADDLQPTAWIVGQARQMLTNVPAATPLFLTVSFFTPHPPLYPPKRYFDYYTAQKLPAPAHGDWVDWKVLTPKGDAQGHRVLLEGATLRATQAGYFGLIEHLDNQVAPLIAEFKARSAAAHRPWIILLTADHGEMLGDHGFFRKCEPYEGSANIPLIISASPELHFKVGSVSTQPVCLEDIMPTLLELAGAPVPKPMDGISLVSTLRGAGHPIRAWLHSEHAPCYSKAQAFHALTDGHSKYIWRPLDGSEQLFNLDEDLREEHDLSKAQPEILAQCRARLIRLLSGRPEGFTDGVRLVAGRPYPPIQNRAN